MAKKISERKRALLTSRRKVAPFLQLMHSVIDSPEWANLNGGEVKFLIDIARQYNGRNNGNFDTVQLRVRWEAAYQATPKGAAGMRPAAFPGRRWSSEGTVTRLARGLVAKGFLVVTKQGGLGLGPTLYAITWWPIDQCNGRHEYPIERLPSHAWRKKAPHPKEVRLALKTGEGNAIAAPERGVTGTIAERILDAA